MRETVRSLRIYFLLSGLVSLWFGFQNLVSDFQAGISPVMILVIATGVASAGLALGFVYVGLFLEKLLQHSSNWIVVLLYASIGLAVLSSTLSFLGGGGVTAIVVLAITLLILWYLLRNVRRLAAEAHLTPSTGVGEQTPPRAWSCGALLPWRVRLFSSGRFLPMTKQEKKRLSAVLRATEYLFLENIALKPRCSKASATSRQRNKPNN